MCLHTFVLSAMSRQNNVEADYEEADSYFFCSSGL